MPCQADAAQANGQLAGRLEEARAEVARLARGQACLEAQVEQLTSSLVDATARKGDGERRLRQYQQVHLSSSLLPHLATHHSNDLTDLCKFGGILNV